MDVDHYSVHGVKMLGQDVYLICFSVLLTMLTNVLNLGLSGTVRTDMSPYGLVAMRSHDAQHGLCFFVTIYR